MVDARYLIVNADDFGQTPGINRGIVRAHEEGIVTSASLMVRWPAAAEAAAYLRTHPTLSAGIHVDLGEWTYRDETWVPAYQVLAFEDEASVRAEVTRQLAMFRQLVGRAPTHLDSHQHAHRREPIRTVMIDVAKQLQLPLRELAPAVRYCGSFYGQTNTGEPLPAHISSEALTGIIRGLPPGVTELGCHPGLGDDSASGYRLERSREVDVLCDPDIRAALTEAGVQLSSFGELATLLGTAR